MSAMRHVLEAQQFTTDFLAQLFKRASEFQAIIDSNDVRKHQKLGNLLSDRMMVTLFFEPSTRTRISFTAAGQHLGMKVVSTENALESSSAVKGETLEDTIKVICQYRPDVIVLRHFEPGAAKRAAAASSVPIINAGDGAGQHPTQALLDLYTIYKETGRTSDLQILIGGDLANSRTSRSLSYMVGKYPNNHIILVSPKQLRMGSDIKSYLKRHKTTFEETEDLPTALKKADVVYWPRIQKERYSDGIIPKSLLIGLEEMSLLKKQAILMSPLPRIDEIAVEVDKDPRAAYFRQAGNGMFIRMALLEWVLGLL